MRVDDNGVCSAVHNVADGWQGSVDALLLRGLRASILAEREAEFDTDEEALTGKIQ